VVHTYNPNTPLAAAVGFSARLGKTQHPQKKKKKKKKKQPSHVEFLTQQGWTGA
jgi:hypothetical protein